LNRSASTLLGNPSRIVIVDDVITKGATLIAAASALHAAYPDAEIRPFAVLRTMGFRPEVGRILDPCEGVIKLNAAGRSERTP
jgi:adenine/guanine phosphoribosyltransferase-like PRPP-binding protein